MLQDLGMRQEIDKEGVLNLARDIDEQARGSDATVVSLAAGRGRALLRHLKMVDFVFDRDLSQKLRW